MFARRLRAERPIRVLFSFDNVGARTINPFTDLLYEAVASAGLRPAVFSWRTALVGRYDVLHLQWPEMHLRDPRWYLRPVQYALFLAMIARTVLSRIPIVQTQHNLRPHEAGRRAERLILALTTRLTTLWIRLVDEMDPPTGLPEGVLHRTIPHGSYTDRYRDVQRGTARPGRLLFFGLIRSYKGVDVLLDAFGELADPHAELRICGEPDDPALAARIERLAMVDDRVSTRLAYLPDTDLLGEIDAAEVVVLPYREMNNSGAAILALGRDRPIIVPDGRVTATLAEDTGTGWVARYPAPLTTDALRTALAELREARDTRSDTALTLIGWDEIGALHAAAYRDVLAARRSLSGAASRRR